MEINSATTSLIDDDLKKQFTLKESISFFWMDIFFSIADSEIKMK